MDRCVCCTVRGDLIRALTELMEKGTQFDAVLIETTGLADPAPVAFTFYANSDVNEYYKIDSILTLVDCKHVKTHLEEQKPDGVVNEAVQQVSSRWFPSIAAAEIHNDGDCFSENVRC